jgi:hypothetical protein
LHCLSAALVESEMEIKNMKLTISLLCCVLLTGCLTNGFRGMLEEKDVDLFKPELTIQSPWGTQVLKADSLRTRVSKGTNASSNPLPPLPLELPKPAGGTITVPLELGVTVRPN